MHNNEYIDSTKNSIINNLLILQITAKKLCLELEGQLKSQKGQLPNRMRIFIYVC